MAQRRKTPETPAELVLANRSANTQAIGSTLVKPGAEYVLSETDLSNERLMAKLAHAEKLGLIEWL